jgi:23S rRNA (uracil1939-C5)-methyltransferase
MKPTLPAIGEQVEVAVETIAATGKGKGSAVEPGYEKLSFFVPGVAPGDRVLAQVTAAQKRYVEADLVTLLEGGDVRVEAPCPHYDVCGGCQLMHLNYEAQLDAKRENLAYLLRRRKVGPSKLEPIEPSPDPLGYRVRCMLNLEEDGRFGMLPRRSNEVVDLSSCRLMRGDLQDAIFAARDAIRARYPAGRIKVAGVVDPSTPGRVFFHPYSDPREMHATKSWFVFEGGELVPTEATDCTLRHSGFEFTYAADCFTQVNPGINGKIVAHAVEALQLNGRQRVLELYAGIGNFTLPIAAGAKRVTAVEWVRAAQYLRANAERAGLKNVTIVPGDVVKRLREMARKHEGFEAMLLDPPREGIGRWGAELIGALGPHRIVYVSCEPKTLLADLATLSSYRYQLKSIRGFDMFPQTFHLETVAVLER